MCCILALGSRSLILRVIPAVKERLLYAAAPAEQNTRQGGRECQSRKIKAVIHWKTVSSRGAEASRDKKHMRI